MSDCPNDHRYNERQTSACQYSEDSAKKAVREVFAILGVNIDSPSEVENFRKSLRFGDTLRQAADKGMLVLISCIVAAMVGALWIGLKQKIVGG